MQLVIAVALHFVGDYVMQRMLWSIAPNKLESFSGMLIHALYAEGPAMLALMLGASRVGALVCILLVPMHMLIDHIGGADKSTLAKCIDQAAHLAALIVAYLVR